MTANVALTDTFDQWRVKTNEVVAMTQTEGMNNIIKTLDTTNSTSNTTGSIITAGGLATKKSVYIGENLTVQGNVVVAGDTTISGNLTFGDAATDQVTFTADINSNIIPNANLTFNVGNTTMLWANTWTGHLGVTQKTDSGKPAVTVTSTDVDQIAISVTASQTTADVLDINAGAVTTAKAIDITAGSLTTGSAIAVDSDSDSTATRNIVSIIQNHADATAATALYVKQDSTLAAAKFDAQTTIIIPAGTTAQRGTAAQGGIRYNTTTSSFEGYSGSSWGSLGGLIDVDQDTKIIAETSAGADNDDLDFYTAGTQRMKIDETGIVTIGVDDAGTDLKLFGYTASKYWLWDASADKTIQVGDSLITGATTVVGASQFTGAVTVGVDDTGHSVKFFGATAGSFMLWNESTDSLHLTDASPIKIGDAQDMTLYHDGTNSYITNAVGALKVATETSGIAVSIGHTTSETTIGDNLTVTGSSQHNGALTVGVDDTGHDVKFFGATAGSFLLWNQTTDALHFTDATKLKLGDSQDFQFYHDGTNSYIENSTGVLNVATNVSGIAISIGHTTSETTVNDNLTVTGTHTQTGATQLNNTLTVGVDGTGQNVTFFGDTAGRNITWDQSADQLEFSDSTQANFGTGNDMILYHDGSNSYISNAVGALKIATATSGIAVSIGHTTSETTINDNLSVTGTLDVAGSTVFNEASAAVDFRIESDGDTHMFMLDGTNNRIGIGHTPSQVLDIRSASAIVHVIDETSPAADTGAFLQLGGLVNRASGGDNPYRFAGIKGARANNSNDNYLSYMSFYTSGSGSQWNEHMRIDGNGNVGIGTTAPSGILEIEQDQNGQTMVEIDNNTAGTAAIAALKVSADAANARFRVYSSGYSTSSYNIADAVGIHGFNASGGMQFVLDHASADMSFWTNSTQRVTIDGNNGNVGIGVATPVGFTPALEIRGSQPAICQSIDSTNFINTVVNSGNVQTWFDDSAYWKIGTATNSGGTSFSEKVRIKNNGYVGIGGIDPVTLLHLNHSNTTALSGNADSFYGLNIHNTGGLNAISSLTFTGADHSGDGSLAGIYAKHTNVSENSEAAELHLVTSQNELLVEAMTIAASGYVGIKTTSPSARFHVKADDGTWGTILQNDNGGGAGLQIRLKANDTASNLALGIETWDTGTTYTYKVRVRRDGRIGIGTSGEPQGRFQINGTSSGVGDLGNFSLWAQSMYTGGSWLGYQNWSPHSASSADAIMQHKGTYEWGYTITALQGHHGSNTGATFRFYSKGYGYGGVYTDGNDGGWGGQAPQLNGPRGGATYTRGGTHGVVCSSLSLKPSATNGGSPVYMYNAAL